VKRLFAFALAGCEDGIVNQPVARLLALAGVRIESGIGWLRYRSHSRREDRIVHRLVALLLALAGVRIES